MNRRRTLKKLMMASGGLVALPAWASEWSVNEIVFPPIFSATVQDILSSVADTIIPAGDDIGALTVGVDKFLQKLFSDCYEQSVQDNIKIQLNDLEKSSQEAYSKSFTACDQLQRETLLMARSTSEDQAENDFFKLLKSETIRGFRTSKKVMTEYHNYVVAPGHFHGCVDVNI